MNLSSVNPNMKELEEVISVMEEIISNLKDLKHLSQEKEVEIKVKWDEWVKCPSCKTNCIRLHNYCRICWVKLKWIA